MQVKMYVLLDQVAWLTLKAIPKHVQSNLGSRGKDSALKARITTPRHYNASDMCSQSSLRLDSALPMEILHLAEALLAEAGMLSVAQALAGQTPTGGASYGVPSC